MGKINPFDEIRNKAIEGFEACDHLDNSPLQVKIQGLFADIECYCDFVTDVEMPDSKTKEKLYLSR